jgi:hypothetical protein
MFIRDNRDSANFLGCFAENLGLGFDIQTELLVVSAFLS